MIETERLLLRRPAMRDAPMIATLIGDFAVCGNLSRVPYPYGLADSEYWLNLQVDAHLPAAISFAITTADDGLIGVVGFDGSRGIAGAEIGYWLGKPYWGRGIMTEAACAALGWYFATTDAAFVRSCAFAFNAASLAIQTRLGFTQTSQSSRHCLARGQDLGHIDTQLTRSAWTERQKK